MYLKSARCEGQRLIQVTVFIDRACLLTANLTSTGGKLHAKTLVYLILTESLEGNTMLGTICCRQLIIEGGRNSRPRSTLQDSHLSPRSHGIRWVLMKRGGSFHKTKSATTIRPSNYASGLVAQRNENLCSHKNLCVNVHRVFICLSPKLEAAQML